MTGDIAEALNKILLECNGQLAEAADLAKQGGESEEVKAYRRAIGHIMMKIYEELMLPIYRANPHLIPERERSGIESDLERSGRSSRP